MSIRNLILVLGDQLSPDISSLRGATAEDVVLLCEVVEEATYVRHHPKKIAFLFSAMRHFARELERAGMTVAYVRLDDPDNAGSFSGEVARAAGRLSPERIVVTEPGEWRVSEMMEGWQRALNRPVEDPGGQPVSLFPVRIRSLGGRQEIPADGIFLPRHAPQDRAADGG